MSLLGMVADGVQGHQNERRNYRNEREMMQKQYGNQRMLNQQGHDLQMDMWNKTNYGAQVGHMKDAGLNPALMYGSAGQGGTTGSQGGGSASKGSSQMNKGMDISNMLMGKQAELLDAQKQKTEAETRNIKGETPESLGRIEKLGAEAKNIIQKTLNLKTDNEIGKVQKGLLELKESKQVTGSAVVDLMTMVGLDPVNNEGDRDKVRALLGLYFGSKVVKDIMQGIGGLKGRSIKNVGDRIYNNNQGG